MEKNNEKVIKKQSQRYDIKIKNKQQLKAQSKVRTTIMKQKL